MRALSCMLSPLLLICIATAAVAAPVQYRVAVIDRFYPSLETYQTERDISLDVALYGLADLNGDRRREPLYHGDLVTLIARHPQISFLHYPLTASSRPTHEILTNLRELRLRHQRTPVDALLLCWESSTLISAFDPPFNRDRAGAFKRLIDYWGIEDAVWRDTREIIDELEALADLGIRVVTIAGNGGKRMVNAFSFAEGVTTVGAEEAELRDFVADNPFVDTYAPAARVVRPLSGVDGSPAGFDINGDECADITATSLSGTNTGQPRRRMIKGSSFAAPAALKTLLPGLAVETDCLTPAAH
ncbi:hypothetical protein [Motiliproteus sediminis]|uniref:hypothetical protein n=1 Tax=Motiliproteus sediminis TaxID=1468178 RepID=UPI001AEFE2BF|nr:hypothetical protein [Motiliproteus sediminis]